MRLINFGNNIEDEISREIDLLTSELKLVPDEKARAGQEYFFSFKEKEEIEEIFILFGLPDYIKYIDYLKECEAKTFKMSKKAISSSPNKDELLQMREFCLSVLERINRKSKKIQNLIVFYERLNKLVTSDLAISQSELDVLIEMLDNMGLSSVEKDSYRMKIEGLNEDKIKTIAEIPKRLDEALSNFQILSVNKTMVEMFEAKLDTLTKEKAIKKSKKVNTNSTFNFYYNMYFSPLSEYYLGKEYDFLKNCNLSEYGETIEKTIKSINKEGLNIEKFSYFVILLLEKIKSSDKKEYKALLEAFHSKFMPYFEKKKQVDKIRLYMKDIPKKVNELFYEELDKLRNLYNELEKQFKKFNISDLEKIEKIISDINDIIIDINTKLSISYENREAANSFGYELRGFAIFDCDYRGQTFVEEDMLSNDNLIEHTAVQRTPKYGLDMSKLVANFILRGTEFITDDMDSGYDKEKICNEIRGYDNKGKVDFKKSTGIYRLRPDHNSNARIAERKIVIPKDTKLYSQVIESIKKFYPNFNYDSSEDLIIYDICGAAVKAADWDLYRLVINRKNNGELNVLKLFAKNGIYVNKSGKVDFEVKDEFTDEEIEKFETFIQSTMIAMDKLNKSNPDFNFDFDFSSRKNIFKKI